MLCQLIWVRYTLKYCSTNCPTVSVPCPSPDQWGALLHAHLRAARLPRPDDGVQRGLWVSAGFFPQPRHLLLQRLGRLLDPLRALQLPRPPVFHEARRVSQVQWLGGLLRHHWLLSQSDRFLVGSLYFIWFLLGFFFTLGGRLFILCLFFFEKVKYQWNWEVLTKWLLFIWRWSETRAKMAWLSWQINEIIVRCFFCVCSLSSNFFFLQLIEFIDLNI